MDTFKGTVYRKHTETNTNFKLHAPAVVDFMLVLVSLTLQMLNPTYPTTQISNENDKKVSKN